jgi:signal transduction histidine kinase
VLEAIFGALTDGVCLSDGGRVTYLNPAAERLLGARPGARRDESACDMICGRLSAAGEAECASGCPLRDPAEPQQSVTFSGRHEAPPVYSWRELDVQRVARTRSLRVRCLRLEGTNPVGKEGLHLTLIEDASAEQELEARKEDWRSMVVHDLRAPLANVYGALRTVQDGPGERDADALDIATRNCRRVMGLLDVYLDMAKIDAGRMSVKTAEVDVGACARTAVEELSYLARERSIRAVVDVAPGLRALADAGLLARVLQNLLHNAYKFSPNGGVVRVSAQADEPGRAVLTVRNDGPLLTPEELPALFKRFSRGAAGATGRGTGLGLAFCREALRAMGGEVAVASGPETGTVFTVVLPRARG